MIPVPNGGEFSFQNHTLTKLVEVSEPFLKSLQVLNKTKRCAVNIATFDGKMTIIITNPDDEIFKLEEPHAETHSI